MDQITSTVLQAVLPFCKISAHQYVSWKSVLAKWR